MKIILKYRGKKINLDLKVCNSFEKFSGLMFMRRENAKALLFDFKKRTKVAIHSCFVLFPFIAIWLDDKNNVIDLKIIQPNKFFVLPKRPFSRLIEIPMNRKYEKIVKALITY